MESCVRLMKVVFGRVHFLPNSAAVAMHCNLRNYVASLRGVLVLVVACISLTVKVYRGYRDVDTYEMLWERTRWQMLTQCITGLGGHFANNSRGCAVRKMDDKAVLLRIVDAFPCPLEIAAAECKVIAAAGGVVCHHTAAPAQQVVNHDQCVLLYGVGGLSYSVQTNVRYLLYELLLCLPVPDAVVREYTAAHLESAVAFIASADAGTAGAVSSLVSSCRAVCNALHDHGALNMRIVSEHVASLAYSGADALSLRSAAYGNASDVTDWYMDNTNRSAVWRALFVLCTQWKCKEYGSLPQSAREDECILTTSSS